MHQIVAGQEGERAVGFSWGADSRPSTQEIVRAWEWGEPRHPIDRGLVLLDLAWPGAERPDLASLSIGQRNAILLDLRARLFGPTMRSFVSCPTCSAALGLELPVAGLRGDDLPPTDPLYDLKVKDMVLQVRLPDSRDLAALVAAGSLGDARGRLVRRCIVSATHDGLSVPIDSLPMEIIAALADEMHALEPPAALMLGLTCAECGHAWSAALDIVSYLWSEVSRTARQLLREVHDLARAYGWAEDAILALSDARRRQYLEMVRA